MASWPVPQYSWQGIRCSPGVRKVVVKVATKPGISIVFALVVPTTKPWIASVLVPRKVTGRSAGTTMHGGMNEYCCATRRTVTLPSTPTAVPRLLSTNSPARCSVRGSMVSTRDGGIEDQCNPVTIITMISDAMISATTIAQRRSAPIATDSDAWLPAVMTGPPPPCQAGGACSCSLNHPPRQVGEEVEREEDRDHHEGRGAGHREGAVGAARDDL